MPGPITVVSHGLGQVAQGVESEYGTLGIRIPNYQLVLDIIKAYGKPITATSANASYLPKPFSIEACSPLQHIRRKQTQPLTHNFGKQWARVAVE